MHSGRPVRRVLFFYLLLIIQDFPGKCNTELRKNRNSRRKTDWDPKFTSIPLTFLFGYAIM